MGVSPRRWPARPTWKLVFDQGWKLLHQPPWAPSRWKERVRGGDLPSSSQAEAPAPNATMPVRVPAQQVPGCARTEPSATDLAPSGSLSSRRRAARSGPHRESSGLTKVIVVSLSSKRVSGGTGMPHKQVAAGSPYRAVHQVLGPEHPVPRTVSSPPVRCFRGGGGPGTGGGSCRRRSNFPQVRDLVDWAV